MHIRLGSRKILWIEGVTTAKIENLHVLNDLISLFWEILTMTNLFIVFRQILDKSEEHFSNTDLLQKAIFTIQLSKLLSGNIKSTFDHWGQKSKVILSNVDVLFLQWSVTEQLYTNIVQVHKQIIKKLNISTSLYNMQLHFYC